VKKEAGPIERAQAPGQFVNLKKKQTPSEGRVSSFLRAVRCWPGGFLGSSMGLVLDASCSHGDEGPGASALRYQEAGASSSLKLKFRRGRHSSPRPRPLGSSVVLPGRVWFCHWNESSFITNPERAPSVRGRPGSLAARGPAGPPLLVAPRARPGPLHSESPTPSWARGCQWQWNRAFEARRGRIGPPGGGQWPTPLRGSS
jgi:hypothetical protein